MIQRRHYKNPPVEEAICEFRFKPREDWDLTIPGKLQMELGDSYSGKPREQKTAQVGLDFQGEGRPNLRYDEGIARFQLVTKNGKRMVGIGPGTLNVHMLRPYQTSSDHESGGWNEFKVRISEALDAYWNILKPEGVLWVSLRYINKIIISQTGIRIEDYLRNVSFEVPELPENYSSYMSRIEYFYSDRVRLILSQGTISGSSESAGLLLDLDVIRESREPIQREAAIGKMDDLHVRVSEAFEAVITDKAREIFDAD